MSGALTRYRVMAYVTGVVLAVMTISFVVRHLGAAGSDQPTWYVVGWTAHGWLYLIYLLTTVDLATRARWRMGRTVLVALAGTIPFMSFVAEHYVTKDVRAQLAAAGAPPGA